MEINYKHLLNNINTFIFDVDGVLTDGSVTLFPNGDQVRTMNVKDGYAIKLAIKEGYKVAIITGGNSPSVRTRMENLGVKDIYLACHDKQEAFEELMHMYDLKKETILYMGDDMPDYDVMQMAGLASCPNDAIPEIKKLSHYISFKNGGKGCVRDVIEQTLKLHGKWMNDTNVAST